MFAAVYQVLGQTKDPGNFMLAAMAFVAIHEAGHAFLGENGVTVLGKEEDVVDDFSAILFIALKRPDVPLLGTLAMLALSQGGMHNYADEHSLSEQRYFTILCLIYGSNPTEYADLIGAQGDYKLPQARADRCPGEWQSKVKALQSLVGPFLRK
jgi:hypothetical protein